jgi:TRAP-type mannitol/chloroaromatic compound transport system permease small subunit
LEKLLRLSRAIDNLNERIGRFTSWLGLLMIIIGVWNVLGRYIGKLIGANLSSNAYIEAQWYLFDLLFFLAAAYALKHNEHVRVDVFYSNWSRKTKAIADLLGTIFFLIPFCLVIIIYSWEFIFASWKVLEVSSDPGGLPRYPIKAMIIIAFVLLIVQGISEAIKNWGIFTGQLTLSEEHHDAGV